VKQPGRRIFYGALLTVLLVCSNMAQSPDTRLAAKFKEATDAQRSGRLEEAAAAYAEVIKLQPDLAEVYVNFGLVRHEQKKYEEAIGLFEKAISLKPSLAGAHLFLGIDQYSLGRFEPALRSLEEAARMAPDNPQSLMWLGVAALAAGRTADAAKHLDRAAALAPNEIDILYHRGRAHLKLSQESYQQMFKIDPKSARVHQVLAQSYEEAGKDSEAIAEYELTLKLAPAISGINEALGSLLWKNHRMDEAEAAFERELTIDPHNSIARYKLGGMHVERGRPEKGLPLLESAIRQSRDLPELIDAFYYLGKAQGLLGHSEAAIANLKKVIDGNATPHIVEAAWYQLARIQRKLGRANEADAALTTYQKLKTEREQQQAERMEKIIK
jgi:tetratricopeptide (TPR) repeat protein